MEAQDALPRGYAGAKTRRVQLGVQQRQRVRRASQERAKPATGLAADGGGSGASAGTSSGGGGSVLGYDPRTHTHGVARGGGGGGGGGGTGGRTLSGALQRCPGSFTRHQIYVAGSQLLVVDRLPDRYGNARTIMLGSNDVASLAGFRQFASLERLSLANNMVVDIAEVIHLQACHDLRVLDLTGNPVTEIPNFRLHVARLLPTLATLNLQPISEGERSAAKTFLERESRALDLMFSNDCLIHKLKTVFHVMQVSYCGSLVVAYGV